MVDIYDPTTSLIRNASEADKGKQDHVEIEKTRIVPAGLESAEGDGEEDKETDLPLAMAS